MFGIGITFDLEVGVIAMVVTVAVGEPLLAVNLAAVPAMIEAMAAAAPHKRKSALPHHGIWMMKFHFKR